MQVRVNNGASLPLEIMLGDGDTGKFPRALVYDSAGSLVATKDLTHVANGLYRDASFTPSNDSRYTALYVVYQNSGHTIEANYPRVTERFDVRDTGPSSVDYTSARATKIDNLDATVSSRAPASTAVSNADLTPARAAKIDNLDATVSSREPASTAVSNADLTPARAAKLDNVDVAVSTRLAAASYTAPDNASVTAIKAKTDNLPADPASNTQVNTRAPASTAVSNADLTPARAAKLDNVDVAVSTRLAASGYTAPDNTSVAAIKAKTDNLPADPASNTQVNTRAPASSAVSNADLTPARAAKLDNLDDTITSRSPAATALSNAIYTNARAAKLDNLDALVSTIAAAVWDVLTASHTTPGTFGAIVQNPTLSPTQIADAVWDAVLADHLDAGSTGEKLNAGTPIDPAQVADAVWDEPISGHLTAGSAGEKLNSAEAKSKASASQLEFDLQASNMALETTLSNFTMEAVIEEELI